MGLAKRANRTADEKKSIKSEYDRKRRAELADRLNAEKAAYYQRTRNPEKEREARKLRMPKHIEYCRQPKYKAYKQQYDRQYRAEREYGEFGNAALVLFDIEREVRERASRVDIAIANGTLNKSTQRKREYERTNSIQS